MQKSRHLLERIKKTNHQGLPLTNLFHVMKEYWPLGQYMLRTFGWRSWYSFWYTKLFVADEGGEYAIKNYIYRRFPLLLRKPFKIETEHTTICDKRCVFCEHTYWAEEKKRVSFEDFKKIVGALRNLRWINITGEGSGFLNKDFMRILEYLRKRHINVNFVDEFDFFDEAISRRVIELGINSIYVSFDAATKESYEKIKKGCDFDKALGNIRRLLCMKGEMNSPLPVLHFRFIVSSLNYQEMPAFVELISKLPNRGVRARVEFVGLLTFPEIEQYYVPLDRIPEEILVETFENALRCGVNLHFAHAWTQLPPMDQCSAWVEPYVLIGGEVISCCAIVMSNNRQFLRDNSFGNVYERPFMEIWKSAKYRNFRKQVNNRHAKVPKTCYGCRAYNTLDRAQRFGVDG